jgi:hypothetical protein
MFSNFYAEWKKLDIIYLQINWTAFILLYLNKVWKYESKS